MAAGSTYTPIATTQGTGSANTITFSSIPSTYTDLYLVTNVFTASNANIQIQVNNDTGNNYSATYLAGNGTTASSSRVSNASYMVVEADVFSSSTVGAIHNISFMNYANTTTYKTMLVRSDQANRGAEAFVNLWRSTAAINSIKIYTGGANFTTNAIFTLYGIAAA